MVYSFFAPSVWVFPQFPVHSISRVTPGGGSAGEEAGCGKVYRAALTHQVKEDLQSKGLKALSYSK